MLNEPTQTRNTTKITSQNKSQSQTTAHNRHCQQVHAHKLDFQNNQAQFQYGTQACLENCEQQVSLDNSILHAHCSELEVESHNQGSPKEVSDGMQIQTDVFDEQNIDWNGGPNNHHNILVALKVIASGTHNSNKNGLNIVINQQWNVDEFKQLLQQCQYRDMQIINYLKYGWPVNRSLDYPNPRKAEINHKGANDFKHDIDNYIAKEIKAGRIAGPYTSIPFTERVGVSPISSRPKKDSSGRRVIIDFSWPLGQAVNDGIDKDVYMGSEITLTYPTVDTLAKRISDLGVGCATFKKDLKSAFRQLMSNPFDLSLMLYCWRNKFFIDLAVAMGLRSAPLSMPMSHQCHHKHTHC